MKKIWEAKKCPNCSSYNLIEDFNQGEIICQNCGLVVNENIMDEKPEWRTFTKEEREKRGRAGGPTAYYRYDKGLSTIIDHRDRDASGKQLLLSKRSEAWKLKKWQITTCLYSSVERNLSLAMQELGRLADIFHIPEQVKERAAIIYRKALNNSIIKTRPISGMVAAALYAACRTNGIPRTLKEFASVCIIKKKTLSRYYKFLIRGLNIKMPVEDPIRYISKIATKIKIPEKTQIIAIKILKKAKKRGVATGKNPISLAATAIYIACLLDRCDRTQKEIAEVAKVTTVTVRNRYRDLLKVL